MASEIYLVRHGQTEWNREDRMQGQGDSPLTARGEEQVRAIGRMLAARGLSGLPAWVSPLGRTRATAALLAEEMALGPVTVEPRLQEIALGSWEGITATEIAVTYPAVVGTTPRAVWGFLCPDGEGFAAGARRIEAWLRDCQAPTVIAVAHGMIGRVLRSVYTGMAPEDAMAEILPQDVVWHFHDGTMTVLPVDEGTAQTGPNAASRQAGTAQN